MRILLIGNYAPDRQESMLRFAELMHRELKARAYAVDLLRPAPVLTKLVPAGGSLRKWLGYVDKFVLFPPRLRKAKRHYDVIHICDHSNALYVKHIADKPHVVTCHDLLAIKSALGEVPQNRVSASGRLLQKLILNGLKAAQCFVCVSEATRADLSRIAGPRAGSVKVVHSSMNYPYSPMPREAARERLAQSGFDARSPFFIHVGGAQWYKNRLGVLRIFSELHKLIPNAPRLLMVGKPLSAELSQYIADNNLKEAVTALSGVSNEDLRAAYSLAEGLIFPSLQEGFGWPVLEAQACECPVYTTGRAPMTEVGGSAAVYFDPEDVAAAARIIADAQRARESMRQRGLDNVRNFSVSEMIQGYTFAYQQVCAKVAINQSSETTQVGIPQL